MRNKQLICILLVLVLVSALIPTAYAYMVHKSQTVTNVFIPAHVSCKVVEEFDDIKKDEVKVKNTGNIDAYIRVRVVYRWEDSKGNPVARDASFPKAKIDTANWTDMGNNIYLCKTAVGPDGLTPDLLKEPFSVDAVRVEETLQGGQKIYYDYYPVMEVLAEAVQSNPADAAKEAWGVTITDGKIQ